MKRKGWLLVLLVLIVISQFTVLSSFFHSFQMQGVAQNYSIIEIGKMNYVSGWASIDIRGAAPGYPVSVQFSNGTAITLSSEYKFVMDLPRTGDCSCNGGTNLPDTNVYVNESQPIEAAILSNASSFDINYLPASGAWYIGQGMSSVYWFTIRGGAMVTISGYGVSY